MTYSKIILSRIFHEVVRNWIVSWFRMCVCLQWRWTLLCYLLVLSIVGNFYDFRDLISKQIDVCNVVVDVVMSYFNLSSLNESSRYFAVKIRKWRIFFLLSLTIFRINLLYYILATVYFLGWRRRAHKVNYVSPIDKLIRNYTVMYLHADHSWL